MSFEDDEYWADEYDDYSFMPSSAVKQEKHYTKRTAPDPVMPTRRRPAGGSPDELAARRQKAAFDAERPSWLDDPDFEPIDTSVDNLAGSEFDGIDFNRPELGIDFDKPDFPIVDPAARPDLRRGAAAQRRGGDNRYERTSGERRDSARETPRPDGRHPAPRYRDEVAGPDGVPGRRDGTLGLDDGSGRRDTAPGPRDRRRDETGGRRRREDLPAPQDSRWENAPPRQGDALSGRDLYERDGRDRRPAGPGPRDDSRAPFRDERHEPARDERGELARDGHRDAPRGELRDPARDAGRVPPPGARDDGRAVTGDDGRGPSSYDGRRDDRHEPGPGDHPVRGRRAVEISPDELWDDEGQLGQGRGRNGDRWETAEPLRDDDRWENNDPLGDDERPRSGRTIELGADEYWEESDRFWPDNGRRDQQARPGGKRARPAGGWAEEGFGPIRPPGGRRPRRDDVDASRPGPASRDELAVTGQAQVPPPPSDLAVTGRAQVPPPPSDLAVTGRAQVPAQPSGHTDDPDRISGTGDQPYDLNRPDRATTFPVDGNDRPVLPADGRPVPPPDGREPGERRATAGGAWAGDLTVGRGGPGASGGDVARGTNRDRDLTERPDRDLAASPRGATGGPAAGHDAAAGPGSHDAASGPDAHGTASGPGTRDGAERAGAERAGAGYGFTGRSGPEPGTSERMATGQVPAATAGPQRSADLGHSGHDVPERAVTEPGATARGTGPRGADTIPQGATDRGTLPPGATNRGASPHGNTGSGTLPYNATDHGTPAPGAAGPGGPPQGAAGLTMPSPSGTGRDVPGQGAADHGAPGRGAPVPGSAERGTAGPEHPDNADRAGSDKRAGGWRAAVARLVPGQRGTAAGTAPTEPAVDLSGRERPVPDAAPNRSTSPVPEEPSPGAGSGAGDNGPRVLRRAEAPVPPKVVRTAAQPSVPRVIKADPPVTPRVVAAPAPVPPARVIGPNGAQPPAEPVRPAASAAPMARSGETAVSPPPGHHQAHTAAPPGPRPVETPGSSGSGAAGAHRGPGMPIPVVPGETGAGPAAGHRLTGPATTGDRREAGAAGDPRDTGALPGRRDAGTGASAFGDRRDAGTAGDPRDTGTFPDRRDADADGRRTGENYPAGESRWAGGPASTGEILLGDAYPGAGGRTDVPQQRSRRTPRTAHVFLPEGDGPWAMVPDAAQSPAGARPVSPAVPSAPGEWMPGQAAAGQPAASPGTAAAPPGHPSAATAWPPATHPPVRGSDADQPGGPLRTGGPAQAGVAPQTGGFAQAGGPVQAGGAPHAGAPDGGPHPTAATAWPPPARPAPIPGHTAPVVPQAAPVLPENAWPPVPRQDPAAAARTVPDPAQPHVPPSATAWNGFGQQQPPAAAAPGTAPRSGAGWNSATPGQAAATATPRSAPPAHAAPTGWNSATPGQAAATPRSAPPAHAAAEPHTAPPGAGQQATGGTGNPPQPQWNGVAPQSAAPGTQPAPMADWNAPAPAPPVAAWPGNGRPATDSGGNAVTPAPVSPVAHVPAGDQSGTVSAPRSAPPASHGVPGDHSPQPGGNDGGASGQPRQPGWNEVTPPSGQGQHAARHGAGRPGTADEGGGQHAARDSGVAPGAAAGQGQHAARDAGAGGERPSAGRPTVALPQPRGVRDAGTVSGDDAGATPDAGRERIGFPLARPVPAGAQEQDRPYMDPDGTLHNLRPIGRLEVAGPDSEPRRYADTAMGSGWFVSKAADADAAKAVDTEPAGAHPGEPDATGANPGDGLPAWSAAGPEGGGTGASPSEGGTGGDSGPATAGAPSGTGGSDAVTGAGAIPEPGDGGAGTPAGPGVAAEPPAGVPADSSGAQAGSRTGTEQATGTGAGEAGPKAAGHRAPGAPADDDAVAADRAPVADAAGSTAAGTDAAGSSRGDDPGTAGTQAGGGADAAGPAPADDGGAGARRPAGARATGQTPPGPELAPHLPLTAADLSAIRWRLDGGTLREVVDDRNALRALGERLDGPLADEADNIVKAGLLSVRAEVYRLLGELGMAAAASRLALAHAESAHDLQSMVIAQAELAHVLRLRGDYMEADRLFQRAVDADVSPAVRSVVHENAGRSCFDQGRHMEALDHFARAIRLGAPDDSDLVERVGVCLEAVYIHVLRDGWGPYPRKSPVILAPLGGRPAEDGEPGDALTEATAEHPTVTPRE